MAENESLDLGGPYAKRWDPVCEKVRKGESPEQVAAGFEQALYRGLAKTLKQIRDRGVTLQELLSSRDAPRRMRQLLGKCLGHQYVRLFIDAAAVSGPNERDCLVTWINAILDTVEDQICHRAVEIDNQRTFDDVRDFVGNVRRKLARTVDRLATGLGEDPSRIPRPPKGRQSSVSPTAELLSISLLGG